MLRLPGGRLRTGFAGTVGRAPAPHLGAFAPAQHALAIDVRDGVAVAAKQRLGGAHLGAGRKLAFRQAVASVLPELGLAAIGLRAAGAEGALVHLAAQAEGAGLRELRRPERAGVEAVAAADAKILVVQHHPVVGVIKTVDRAHRHARRVRAVHARDRDRLLGADDAVIDGD